MRTLVMMLVLFANVLPAMAQNFNTWPTCASAIPPLRLSGLAHHGKTDIRFRIDIWRDPAQPDELSAHASLNNGRSLMVGDLEGFMRDGDLGLLGLLEANGEKYEFALLARTTSSSVVTGDFETLRLGTQLPSRSDFAAVLEPALDASLIGAWSLQTGAADSAGLLKIESTGRYFWITAEGETSGQLRYCEALPGEGDWALSVRGDDLLARVLEGGAAGLYLWSTRTGSYVYRGERAKRQR